MTTCRFAFERSPIATTPQLRQLFSRAWSDIADPGSWWNGPQRIAIAGLARANRSGDGDRASSLPDAANDAVALLAASPSATTEAWVEAVVDGIGLERYIELVGIVSTVVAVDTVTRLLGSELEPLPAPREGTPARDPVPDGVKKRSAWVAMASPPIPPNVLAAVPAAQAKMIEITEALYMTGPEMADPDITKDGLHRTQIELVATTTSLANECFY
jgi:hypothetical protein